MSTRTLYCVACGAIDNGLNGVDVCRKSELGLTHLWDAVGHVQDWFPVKRVYGPDGGITTPDRVARLAGAAAEPAKEEQT